MSATILVVEDEPPLRTLIANALANHGYRVLQARNGSEALAVFDREGADIDLVVTDLMMPYVDGEELVSALREKRRTLKTLCISGMRPMPPDADAFIAKPFSRDAFLAEVQRLLES
jgi:two-component system cell cycle sensor histidine kinase/response regulator CckA